MSDFKIISDSSCDVLNDVLQKNNIDLIPFYVSFDKTTYFKEKEQISIEKFYNKLESENIFPKTSMPSIQDYINKFTLYLDQGMDILCICLTNMFSGSYQAAVNAKNILMETYKNATIEIINSRQSTAGQGLLVLEAARMKRNGLTMYEIINNINLLKNRVRIQFTVDTLEYLQKGGRIGKVSALAGNILNVKPLIVMKKGELVPYGITRGRKRALKKIIEMTIEDLKGEDYNNFHYGIDVGLCYNDADKIKKVLDDKYNIKLDYPYFQIGTTIGTNTGSSAIGICYIPKYETL